MPPKQQAPVTKGQTSLFSFFNKPKVLDAVQPAAITTPNRQITSKAIDSAKNPGSAATSRAGDSPTSASSSQESNELNVNIDDMDTSVGEISATNRRKLCDISDKKVKVTTEPVSIVERGENFTKSL
jgi:hypothetical protein